MRKLLLSGIGLALAIAPVFAQCEQGRLRTSLVGGSIRGLQPSGHIDFLASSGLTRLTAEVEDVNLPAGTRLRVLVDKSEVGTIAVGAVPIRGGELELDTRDGAAVPKLRENSLVEIWAGDRPVMAGVLQQKCAGDTRSRRDDDPEVARRAACAARGGDELRVRTHLSGGNIGGLEPEGHAEFHVRSGQRRDLHFSAEIEDINLPANSKLDVFVGSSRVGSINVGSGALRGGDLRLDSRDGQEVPEIRGSTLVRVVTPEGAPVLTGVLQPEAVCDDNPGTGGSSSSSTAADDSRQRSRLGGGALNGFEPSGYAEFRTRSSRNDARLHVEIEDVNLPAGTVLEVLVNGHRMGTMKVGPPPIRGGELELDSRDGDNLPRADDNAYVTVLGPRGVVVAAGVMRVRSMDDNPSSKPEDRSIASRGRGADDPPGDDRGGRGGNEPGDDKGGGSGSGSGGSGGSGGGSGSGGSGGGSGSGSGGSGSGKP